MRNKAVVALVSAVGYFGLARGQSNDPCANRQSNREIRECYAAEQVRANARVDALVNEIISSLHKEAKRSDVPDHLLRKAESTLSESQKTWKDYSDQHCRAVELTWTTGSGAGTAYEACMFRLARQRIRDLRHDFNDWASPSGRKASK